MKTFAKFAALGAILAASAPLAFATPITGGFSLTGGDNVTSTGTTTGSTGVITVTGAQVGSANQDGTQAGVTGTFLTTGLLDGQAVTFTTPNLPFTIGSTTTLANPAEVFTVSENGYTYDLFVNSYTTQMAFGTILDLEGTGYFTGTGFTNTAATFEFDTQNGAMTTFSASTTTGAAVTPEPNTLLLMGTGLIGAAGLLFSRRRNAAGLA